MTGATPWPSKLAARTGAPAENALRQIRGTTKAQASALQDRVAEATTPADPDLIARADRWAAATDRPAGGVGDPAWAAVTFPDAGEITHPLSGERLRAADLRGPDGQAAVAQVGLDHLQALIQTQPDGSVDAERTTLALWRFAPERPPTGLDDLWPLLPADPRVPDHTLWTHLDLTSAFAGAFAADPEGWPALLQVSLGPVQSFIAQARATADLWAGSHMLATFAFEAMKPILERCGPDALVMPQLRGVPEVDVWLTEEKGLDPDLFADCAWRTDSQANPLLIAAVPNRFLAIVPAGEAAEIGEAIRAHIQAFAHDQAGRAAGALFDKLGRSDRWQDSHVKTQLDAQLAGFPEVTWSAVTWELADDRDAVPAHPRLRDALAAFYPTEGGAPGIFQSDLWARLHRSDGPGLFDPNPGSVYPAAYELGDRALAATKATRTFEALEQRGFRASLAAEFEWLTDDTELLKTPPNWRGETIWSRLAQRHPRLARPGEHLSALDTLKRFWPALIERRYHTSSRVVSTHTLSLAPTLKRLAQDPDAQAAFARSDTAKALEQTKKRVALPARVDIQLQAADLDWLRRLPAYLDDQQDARASEDPAQQAAGESALQQAERDLHTAVGHTGERYYALILMDGDRMGAWLSGVDRDQQVPLEAVMHSDAAARLPADGLGMDARTDRPASPARHAAISESLNGFALGVARPVVERVCTGQLLYAGGDDVMAMCASDDLLRALGLLRIVYSGIRPSTADGGDPVWDRVFSGDAAGLDPGQGFLRCPGDPFPSGVLRTMGPRATASAGAVVAHATTPLSRVVEELRATEQAAKGADRDAFAITVMKRAGAQTTLSLPFGLRPGDDGTIAPLQTTPYGRLVTLVDFLGHPAVSRRAAYLVQGWLPNLPPVAAFGHDEAVYRDMVARTLMQQFTRQVARGAPPAATALAREAASGLAHLPWPPDGELTERIHGMLTVAEFLARPVRLTTTPGETRQAA